jgi:ferredoxin
LWLSPSRIQRNPQTCIDCGLCDKVCMARLPVSRKVNVLSPECTGCLDCVAVCPIKDALALRVVRRRLSPQAYGAAVLLLFLAGYCGARAFGLWENRISDAEYVQRIQTGRVDPYGHPGCDWLRNGCASGSTAVQATASVAQSAQPLRSPGGRLRSVRNRCAGQKSVAQACATVAQPCKSIALNCTGAKCSAHPLR